MTKVGIIGASGYTGVELMRLLVSHPEVEIAFATANTYKGTPVADLYPNFTSSTDMSFTEFTPDLLSGVDLVFLALPHGKAMEVVPQVVSAGVKIVDLSGDFRFADAAVYESWYGVAHSAAGFIGGATYGLTEIYRERVAEAGFVANPGCYPTGALLAAAPFVKARAIDLGSLIVDAKSGASGAGRTPKHETLYGSIDENLTAYKVGKHQHTPEIEMVLSDLAGFDTVVSFTPHLAPMTRGILSTVYADLSSKLSTAELLETAADFYAEDYFVKVLPEGKMPQTKAVAGSNFCHIGAVSDTRSGRAIIVSAIDNLVKGAAGQAIQNMNLMLRRPEETGLTQLGLYP
ncbi:MAG: N-acetyl-gamma-glutamyl-phosphate reductase [Candidatus Aquicultorales bacterium]